mgnify:FL=1
MKFDPTSCPSCGGKPRGTVEQLLGLALLMELTDQPGEYDYEGYTEVWWDDQESIEDEDGEVTLVCVDCGGHWQAAMTPSPEEAKTN